MISYKPVVIQSAAPILTFKDILGEKIRGNYQVFGLSIQAQDLIYMTVQPAWLYIERGQNDVSMAVHKNINNNSIKIEMMNQLINRLLFFGTTGFTYQDEVFVSSMLNKLGITNTAEFMAWVKTNREKSKAVGILLKTYAEISKDAGKGAEIINNLRKHVAMSMADADQEKETDQTPSLHSTVLHRLNIVELWKKIYCRMPQGKAAAALHILSDSFVLEKNRRDLLLIRSKDQYRQEDVYDIAVGCLTEAQAGHKAGGDKITDLIGTAVLINVLQKVIYEQHHNQIWRDYTSYIEESCRDIARGYASDTVNIIKLLPEKTISGEPVFLTSGTYRDELRLYRDEKKLVRAWSEIIRNIDRSRNSTEYLTQSQTEQVLQSYAEQICLMLSDNHNLRQQAAILHRSRLFSGVYRTDSLLNTLEKLQAEEKILLSLIENKTAERSALFMTSNVPPAAGQEPDPVPRGRENDIPVLSDRVVQQESEVTSEYRQYLEWLNEKNRRMYLRFEQEKKALTPSPVMKADKKRVMEGMRGSLEDPGRMQEILKEIQSKSRNTFLPGVSDEAELLLRLADETTRTRYEKMLDIKVRGEPITISQDQEIAAEEFLNGEGTIRREEAVRREGTIHREESIYREESLQQERSLRQENLIRFGEALRPEHRKKEIQTQNNVLMRKIIPRIKRTIKNVAKAEEQIRKASEYDVILKEYRKYDSAAVRKEEIQEQSVETVKDIIAFIRSTENSFTIADEEYKTGKTALVHKKAGNTEDAFLSSAYGRFQAADTADRSDEKLSYETQDHYRDITFTMKNQNIRETGTDMGSAKIAGAQKEQISEIVRSSINTQLGALSDKVYRKLDRRLREERKRKGY